jgi:Glycoside hydrolase family 44
MHMRFRWLLACAVALLSMMGVWLILIQPDSIARAAGDVTIYDEALSWQDWSWSSTINFQNTSPVHAGSHSIAITYTAGDGGLYLHANSSLYGPNYSALRFWIRGTGSNEHLGVTIYDTPNHYGPIVPVTATAGSWTPYTISLSSLGSPNSISGIVWQDSTGHSQPVFYLDDIALIAKPITIALALSVDAQSGVHPISPYIYGMNFVTEPLAAELQLPVDRWGGNSTTRYNYLNDVSNTANDWYFENIPQDDPLPPNLPDGSASDQFIEKDRRTGTQTLLTIPMIGWTAKSHYSGGHPYDCGYSTSKYGPQQSVDPWQTNCGNGITASSSQPITTNNPADTSTAINHTFVQNWINYLKGKYGSASNGGVLFYDLDNEPMLWGDTHRDVHPNPTSYDEMLTRTIEYAAAIKATDPNAQTLGPAEWGWTGYFYSALDVAAGGSWWDTRPDRRAHGDIPFTDWYLQQMKAYEQTHGQRLLDYLDLHFYPQANGVSLSPAGDANTQALRLRSTRSLWDPAYVDESWIGEAIYMIPRMKQWVADNYPGTKIAISEYNWGALDDLNGALAQADVLGIFGREGLDLATLWAPPAPSDPGAYAFRLYRNYDGQHRLFGELSVSAASTDQDQLSIYAARRGFDNALTLMLINKSTDVLTVPLTLSNYNPQSSAQVYRYSGSNLNSIVHLPDIGVSSTGFTATYPASSITLIIMQPIIPPLHVYLPIILK